MLINGRNRLACKIRVDQLGGKKITVAPLPGLPVMKDLVVDMEGFFAKFRSVQPFLQNDGMPPERERRQSAEDRAKFDDTTKCILCAACTTSCPSFWAKPEYVGPAAIVNAHRFIFDSRDDAAEERLEILADKDGVWRCRTIFNCTDACPRGHPHHPGDPRGLLGDRGAARLSAAGEGSGPGGAVPLPVIPHLVIRTDGAARGNPGPASLGAALIDGSRADALDPVGAPGRHDLRGARPPDQQRRRVDRASWRRSSSPGGWAPSGWTCSWTRS